MKTTVIIADIKEKTSSGGKTYYAVKTSEGAMTLWDTALVPLLQIGNAVDIEFTVKGDFKTIEKAYAATQTEKPGVVETPRDPVQADRTEEYKDKFKAARDAKNTTMYVSYAKDIFCKLCDKSEKEMTPAAQELIMNMSLELVEQAIDRFS